MDDMLAVVGFLAACWLTFKLTRSLFRGVHINFLAANLGLNADLSSYGEWAVVTGATDGIGKEYALQLAEKGLKIVLISRSTNKLEKVAADIENNYKVETKIITADFTEVGGIYDDIQTRLSGLQVGVLVNNVGMSHLPGKVLQNPNLKKYIPDILHCNCISMTMMTQICLPQMVERKKGVILNVSSLSALSPIPYLGIYSGTKAYVNFFSQALHYEYHDKGIIVQSVMPGFVKTNMTNFKEASLFVPDSSTYVKSALQTVGVETRTFGYISHSLMAYILKYFPEYLTACLTIYFFSRSRKRLINRMKAGELKLQGAPKD